MQSTIIFVLLFFVSIMRGGAITNKRNHILMSSFLQTENTLQLDKNNSFTLPYNQKEIKHFFILDYLFSLTKPNNKTCSNLLYDIELQLSKEKYNETINITEYTCYTIQKLCNVTNCINKLNETFVNKFKVINKKKITKGLNIYDSQCYYKNNNSNNKDITIENIDTLMIGAYDGMSVLVHDKAYSKYKEDIIKVLIEEMNKQSNNADMIRFISKGLISGIDFYYLVNMMNSNQQLISFMSYLLSLSNNAINKLTDFQLLDYSLHVEDDELLMFILTLNLNDIINSTSLYSDNLSIYINKYYPSIPLDAIKEIQNYYRNNIEKDLMYVYNLQQQKLQISTEEEYAKCLNITIHEHKPYNKDECGSLIIKEINKVYNSTLYNIVDKLEDNEIFALPKNENVESGTLDLLNDIGEDELNSNNTKEETNETLDLSFSIASKEKPKRLYRQDNKKLNTTLNDTLMLYHTLHNKTIHFIESQVNQTDSFITRISSEFKEYYISIKNIIISLNKNFEADFPYKVKPELIETKYEKLKQFIILEKKILHKLFNATEIATKLIYTISTELNSTEQINNTSLLNLNRLSLYAIELKRIATKHNLHHFYIDIWVNLIEKILKIKDKEITDIKELKDINETISKVINQTTVKNKYAVFNLIYSDVFKTYKRLYQNIERLVSNKNDIPLISKELNNTIKETVKTIKINNTSLSKVINETHIQLNSSSQGDSNNNNNEDDDSFIGFLKRMFKPETVIYSIVYFIICFILILFYLTFFKRIIYYIKIYLNNNGYDDSNISNKRKTFFILLITSFIFMLFGFILYKDFLISLLFSINGIFIAASLIFEGLAGSRFGKISFAFLFSLLWIRFSLLNTQYEIWIKCVSFIAAEVVGVLTGTLIGNLSIFSFIMSIREAKERVDVINTNNINLIDNKNNEI